MSLAERTSPLRNREKNMPSMPELRRMLLGANLDSGAFRLYRADGDNIPGLIIEIDDTTNNPLGLEIKQKSGNSGVKITQTGDALAIEVDASGVANDGDMVSVTPGGATPLPFILQRNDDVTGNVVISMGGTFFWFDASNVARVSATNPTSDTGGTVVGTQT